MSVDSLNPFKVLDEIDFEVATSTEEARRQLDICNACRYCEGFCSVFPAMTLHRAFADGQITQLANLCHNCRGCYHACQYTEPHEFAVNLPRALAEVRVESWERFIKPSGLSRLFQAHGVALAGALMVGIMVMMSIALFIRPADGIGFYAYISHAIMLAVFLPASILPFVIVAMGVRSYWKEVGGELVRLVHLRESFLSAGRMKNLSGGAADGCNYENEDRFTQARRWAHQSVMWGFLLCFAATASGTLLHYLFGMEAPYGPLSLPKLFGVPGGILMTLGGIWLVALKIRAEKNLSAPAVWGGEMAFVLLLTATAATGLALYWTGGTSLMRPLLVIHLGAVLVLFLTLPYTKMVHAAFRLAALVRDAQTRK